MTYGYTFKGKDRKKATFTLNIDLLPRKEKNWDRALAGLGMYEAAVKRRKKAEEIEQPYTVSDVITNLLHFATAAGFDAQDIICDAEKHWLAETEGDGIDIESEEERT